MSQLNEKKKVAIKTIGELRTGAIYRRKGGKLFYKLNEKFHVCTKFDKRKKKWLGDGRAEMLNADEKVSVLEE